MCNRYDIYVHDFQFFRLVCSKSFEIQQLRIEAVRLLFGFVPSGRSTIFGVVETVEVAMDIYIDIANTHTHHSIRQGSECYTAGGLGRD